MLIHVVLPQYQLVWCGKQLITAIRDVKSEHHTETAALRVANAELFHSKEELKEQVHQLHHKLSQVTEQSKFHQEHVDRVCARLVTAEDEARRLRETNKQMSRAHRQQIADMKQQHITSQKMQRFDVISETEVQTDTAAASGAGAENGQGHRRNRVLSPLYKVTPRSDAIIAAARHQQLLQTSTPTPRTTIRGTGSGSSSSGLSRRSARTAAAAAAAVRSRTNSGGMAAITVLSHRPHAIEAVTGSEPSLQQHQQQHQHQQLQLSRKRKARQPCVVSSSLELDCGATSPDADAISRFKRRMLR
jgi:hypothetical protein